MMLILIPVMIFNILGVSDRRPWYERAGRPRRAGDPALLGNHHGVAGSSER